MQKTDVKGKVVMPDGSPGSGATVYRYRCPANWSRAEPEDIWERVTAAEDGSFAFENVRMSRDRDPCRGDAIIAVQAGAGLAHWPCCGLEPGAEPAQLQLTDAAVLEGIVEDEDGKPVSGAQVVADYDYACDHCGNGLLPRIHQTSFPRTAPLLELTTITDGEGRFRIDHLPKTRHEVRLATWCGPLAAGHATATPDGRADPVTIALHPCGRIEGRVLIEATGEPAQGLKVIGYNQAWRRNASTITNDDGYYTLDNVAPGKCCVCIPLPETAEWVVAERQEVLVRPRSTVTGVGLVLTSGVFFRGRMVEASTRQPAPGVRVMACDMGGHRGLCLCYQPGSGQDGTFQFRCPAHSHSLRIETVSVPAGYWSEWDLSSRALYGRSWATGPGELSTVTGDAGLPELEVAKGVTLVGQVVDPRGRPAAGCVVAPRQTGSSSHTDEQGIFQLPGVRPRSKLTVIALDRPAKLGRSVTLAINGKPTQKVKLKLAPLATMTGRVVDGQGDPVANKCVELAGLLGDDIDRLDQTWTDEDGRYEFHVAPGTECGPYVRGGTRSELLVVAAGQRHEMADLVLKAPSLKIPVTGRVVDKAGQLVPEARITVWSKRELFGPRPAIKTERRSRYMEWSTERQYESSVLTTDAQGRFQIDEGLPDGTPAILWTSGPDGKLAGETTLIPSGSNDAIVLQLAPAAEVVGRVLDEGGQALSGVSVQVYVKVGRMDRVAGEAESDGEGRFRVAGLFPSAHCYATAARRGYWSALRTGFKLQSGRTTELGEIVLRRADSVVSGRVTGRRGRPVSNVHVQCHGREYQRAHSKCDDRGVATDRQGRYQITGVPSGVDLELSVYPPGAPCGGHLERTVQAPATDVDFVVKPRKRSSWKRLWGLVGFTALRGLGRRRRGIHRRRIRSQTRRPIRKNWDAGWLRTRFHSAIACSILPIRPMTSLRRKVAERS